MIKFLSTVFQRILGADAALQKTFIDALGATTPYTEMKVKQAINALNNKRKDRLILLLEYIEDQGEFIPNQHISIVSYCFSDSSISSINLLMLWPPSYLSYLLAHRRILYSLRSVSNGDLIEPSSRTLTYGDPRSFAACTPRLWSSLPLAMCRSSFLNLFYLSIVKRHGQFLEL